MNTIGLFYNENLDTLFAISSLSLIKDDNLIKVELNNIVVFINQKHEIINFNLFSPKEYIRTKLVNGINTDNKILQQELKDFFNDFNLVFVPNPQVYFTVGKIVKTVSHPNADNLTICDVLIYDKEVKIICGAKNCQLDSLVVVALPGTIMPTGILIMASELRGVTSYGMLCSEKELGLANENLDKSIIILEKNKYNIGDSFWEKYYE